MNELTINKRCSKLKVWSFKMPKISYCNRWQTLKTTSMKKFNLIIILISISTLVISCGANPAKNISKTMDKVYIGMSVSEFKEKVENEELVEMNQKVTIFKKVIKSYNHYLYGVPILASVDTRFFYFENNQLVKVDEGERAVDYRVKIDKTSN
jgi:hypothetical protein